MKCTDCGTEIIDARAACRRCGMPAHLFSHQDAAEGVAFWVELALSMFILTLVFAVVRS